MTHLLLPSTVTRKLLIAQASYCRITKLRARLTPKCKKLNTRKCGIVPGFCRSGHICKVQIMPLVIYDFRGGYTHKRTRMHSRKRDFKKPGLCQLQGSTYLVLNKQLKDNFKIFACIFALVHIYSQLATNMMVYLITYHFLSIHSATA